VPEIPGCHIFASSGCQTGTKLFVLPDDLFQFAIPGAEIIPDLLQLLPGLYFLLTVGKEGLIKGNIVILVGVAVVDPGDKFIQTFEGEYSLLFADAGTAVDGIVPQLLDILQTIEEPHINEIPE